MVFYKASDVSQGSSSIAKLTGTSITSGTSHSSIQEGHSGATIRVGEDPPPPPPPPPAMNWQWWQVGGIAIGLYLLAKDTGLIGRGSLRGGCK